MMRALILASTVLTVLAGSAAAAQPDASAFVVTPTGSTTPQTLAEVAAAANAVKPVVYGTTAGTAAEGDDSRIVGALPASGGALSGTITGGSLSGTDVSAAVVTPTNGGGGAAGKRRHRGGDGQCGAPGLRRRRLRYDSHRHWRHGGVDANYVYACTAANTWKRAALSTY